MERFYLLLIVLITMVSCKNESKAKQKERPKEAISIKTYEKVEQLQWLVGHWTNISLTEQSYENWDKTNDSTLKSHSFTLVDKDTVFAERVTLQQIGEDLFFTAVAYNQNDDQPVTFKLISNKNGVFTFENPGHDFPRRISYSNPVQDSIHAWIEGTVAGNPRKVDFKFKRQN